MLLPTTPITTQLILIKDSGGLVPGLKGLRELVKICHPERSIQPF